MLKFDPGPYLDQLLTTLVCTYLVNNVNIVILICKILLSAHHHGRSCLYFHCYNHIFYIYISTPPGAMPGAARSCPCINIYLPNLFLYIVLRLEPRLDSAWSVPGVSLAPTGTPSRVIRGHVIFVKYYHYKSISITLLYLI